MKVELRDISRVEPYERNAKVHSDAQVKKLADSIREFGFNQPIVLDKAGVIIASHGRFLAAELLGIDKVPVVVVDMPPEKAAAYRLADNKLNESEWDMQLVTQELKLLPPELVDLAGFADVKLTERIGEGGEVEVSFLAQGMAECPKCHFKFDPKRAGRRHNNDDDQDQDQDGDQEGDR